MKIDHQQADRYIIDRGINGWSAKWLDSSKQIEKQINGQRTMTDRFSILLLLLLNSDIHDSKSGPFPRHCCFFDFRIRSIGFRVFNSKM